MRSRPASFTAAAPPSSSQLIQRVRPIDSSASSRNDTPVATSLVVSVQESLIDLFRIDQSLAAALTLVKFIVDQGQPAGCDVPGVRVLKIVS